MQNSTQSWKSDMSRRSAGGRRRSAGGRRAVSGRSANRTCNMVPAGSKKSSIWFQRGSKARLILHPHQVWKFRPPADRRLPPPTARRPPPTARRPPADRPPTAADPRRPPADRPDMSDFGLLVELYMGIALLFDGSSQYAETRTDKKSF